MQGLEAAIALAMLPAAGNFAGGVLTAFVTVSRPVLGLALHAAAGVLLAVLSVELLPTALAGPSPAVIVAAFFGGGIAFLLLDAAIHVVERRLGRSWDASATAIFAAVSIDLFADGLMIGSSTTIATSLAFLVALGQVPADVPEGFASIATLAARGVPVRRRLLWSLAFCVPILAGTVVAYLAVRNAPEIVKLSLLAFSAGMLLTVLVEELVPEAHEEGESRWAVFALLGGFSLFTLVSAYVD